MASPITRMGGSASVEKIRSSYIFVFLEFAIVGMATLQMVVFLFVNSSSYISGGSKRAALDNFGGDPDGGGYPYRGGGFNQNNAGFEPPNGPSHRRAGVGAGGPRAGGFDDAGGYPLRGGFNQNNDGFEPQNGPVRQAGGGRFGGFFGGGRGAGGNPPRGGFNQNNAGFESQNDPFRQAGAGGFGGAGGAPLRPLPPLQTFDIIKRNEGGYPNSWTVVNWEEPISDQDESRFNCDWVTFVSSSGMENKICGRRDDENTFKCAHGEDFVDMMYEGESMEPPYFLDIGSSRGACILELLLESDVNIIAFEPHPSNVYSIRKTIMALDKSFQNRVLFFPIALSDEASVKKIDMPKNSAHQPNLKASIYLERLDSILDSYKIKQNAIKLVHLDVQGFECKILAGMGERLTAQIHVLKLQWENFGQNCKNGKNYLDELRRIGFALWGSYDHGKFGKYLQEDSPKYNGVDLWASKLDKIY